MRVNADNWKRLLGAGVLCWFVTTFVPAHAEDREQVSYAEMTDQQLTEALKRWSSLGSSDRRGLLVEIKQRMEQPQQPRSIAPTTNSRLQGFTIRVRMQQTRQFGVKLQSQTNDVRTGGVLVIRGEFSAPGKQSVAMRGAQKPRPFASDEQNPLPGPGFGRGFNERQAFLRAAYSDAPTDVAQAPKFTRLIRVAPTSTEEGVD